MSHWNEQYEKLIGKMVIAVDGAKIYLDSGEAFEFVLDGDCCSHSDFTEDGLDAFLELIGAVILACEEREPLEPGREEKVNAKYPKGDVLSWHFLVFTTDKGHVTIDWRNDSNGYYDGSCSLQEIEPLDPVTSDALLEGMSPWEIATKRWPA